MRCRDLVVIAAIAGILFGCESESEGKPEVTLKLGGEFCAQYADSVKNALMQVPGVHSVDVQRKKGHAVVTGDPHRMKPHGLEEAVDELRGKGWYCDAEVVDDN